MNYKITKLEKKADSRGYLIEFLKNSELENKTFGQNYFVTFSQRNTTRGNHYHNKKSEWFAIASGRAKVVLEDIKTKERKSFELSDKGDYITRLFIGPNIAHKFTSLTNTVVMLNYTNKEYNPKNTDTYPYKFK